MIYKYEFAYAVLPLICFMLLMPTRVHAQDSGYEMLLNHPEISSSLRWYQDGSSNVVAYDQWSDAQKMRLMEIIEGMEAGLPFPIESPPALIDDYYVSRSDAETIYLTHVAHSFWIESNKKVNWSVVDFTADQMRLLYDGALMFNCSQIEKCYVDTWKFGKVTDWNINLSYNFLLEHDMIGATQEQTVYAFAYWGRRHLIHITGTDSNRDGYERLYGYRGYPLVNRILEPLPDRQHITAGCWGTSGLFNAVMRAVNIPAESKTTHLGTPNNDWRAAHSRFEFPTINLGTGHGDDIYSGWLRPSISNNVHSAFLFHSLEWLEQFVDNPKTLDCNTQWCNPAEDQATFNRSKHMLQVAATYFSDYLLRVRAQTDPADLLPESIRRILRGISVGGEVVEFAHPFFNDSEIVDIVAGLDAEIRRMGNGSWEAGAGAILYPTGDLDEKEPDIANYPPFAFFTVSTNTEEALKPIQFVDESIGVISSRSWEFGDGATSVESTPVYAYQFVDTFTVSLTVEGPGGKTTTTRQLIVDGVSGIAKPNEVSLVTPGEMAVDLYAPVELVWEPLAEALRYHLQVAEDAGFLSLAHEETATADTRASIETLSENTTYFWRVRAKNEGGIGPWSEVNDFSTGLKPSPITLISPADLAINQPSTVGFEWHVQPSATRYHLEVATDDLFNTLVFRDTTLTVNKSEAGPLAYNTMYYWRVRASNGFGAGPWSGTFQFSVAAGTAIELPDAGLPDAYILHQNYPNPFYTQTSIRFNLPEAANVRLVVYSILGRELFILLDSKREAGYHEVTFDASGLPGGTYLYRLETPESSFTQSMQLLK